MADSGDILRIVIQYGIPAASTMLNVFYARCTDSVSDENVLLDWVEWATDEWGAAWDNMGALLAEINQVSVDVVDFEGHVLANIGSEVLAIPGTVDFDPAAGGVAAYMKADTEIPKTRGSKYIPGLTEDNIDGGFFDVTILGELAVLFVKYLTDWIGAAGGKTYQMGVPSRTLLEFVPFEGGGTFTDVPAYQRRRKPGVGS